MKTAIFVKSPKLALLVGLGLMLSACATQDLATRNTPFEQLPSVDASASTDFSAARPDGDAADVKKTASADGLPALVDGQSLVTVNRVVVRVPRTLTVSEANRYLPAGDIVWREDPIGDRHAQVQKIFQDAMNKGVTPLNGPVKVNVDIQVRRFHALTEKARYTTGGLHSITFNLAITDPRTGELLVPIRSVRADLDGFGGSQALAAEARGLTQKVRITNHLAEVIRQELSNPKGYNNASLGFYQLLNNI